MRDNDTEVTVRFDALTVRVRCPHAKVDNETILELAARALGDGEWQCLPAPFSFVHESDRPDFDVRVEAFVSEIEDDDREDAPEDFDITLEWWQDLMKDYYSDSQNMGASND